MVAGPSALVLLGVALAVLAGVVATRLTPVPGPVFYVLAGLAVSYAPGFETFALPPHVIFYVFLPPLLYYAAFFTSPRETRAQALPILGLAIGLVLATLFAVGWTVAAATGVLGTGAGFLLGAVLGPTDPIAATAVIGRVRAPERLQAILEGESLVNDGVGLVAFSIALAGVTSGSFSVAHGLARFGEVTAGGVAIGLALGFVVERIRRHVHDVEIEILVSLLTPYVAYIPAERAHVSGVLATVATGIYLGWHSGGIFRPEVRLQSSAFWGILNFLLTSSLFVLLGMEFPRVVGRLGDYSPLTLLWYSLLTMSVVGVVRMAWMFTVPYGLSRLPRVRTWRDLSPWQDRFVLGWSGMRGAVSLAAALSITQAVPHRALLLFLTFATILGGLLLQAVPLPWLLRRLGVASEGGMTRAETDARLALTRAALDRLDELTDEEDWVSEDLVEPLRATYEQRAARLHARLEPDETDEQASEEDYRRLRRELVAAERKRLSRLQQKGKLATGEARRIQHELDLEEARVTRR
ncbi:MAG TPA: Na+/H+ antiporter [Gaiellaceae bacterium]|nr:Na+/H+ antiporter [Gaiellaceae bacterium]